MPSSAALAQQTQLLVTAVGSMRNDQIGEPSLLPKWSRGHVLAHIDGNALGLCRLIRWAIDGNRRDMYISPEVREGDIELYAARSKERHLAAIVASAEEFTDEFAMLSAGQLATEVTLRNGRTVEIGSVINLRLQEVAIHHLDLDLPGDFGPVNLPAVLVDRLLGEVAADFRGRGDVPLGWLEVRGGTRYQINAGSAVGVSGPAPQILAWLLGRSPGGALDLVGARSLPKLPAWL